MRVKLLILLVLVSLAGGRVASFAQTPEPLDGLWLTEGYGQLIEISGGVVTVYEITRMSCLKVLEMPLDGDTLPQLGLTGSLENDQLVVRDTKTYTVAADKLDQRPAVCQDGGTARTDDPELNFEVFWNTFEEQYAFFDLYGMDWQAQYERYRPQITAATTPGELFALLSEMVTPLEDGHISLNNGTDEFSPGTSPEWVETAALDVGDFVQAHYMSGDRVTLVGNKMMAYQKLSDQVGYLLILWMYGYGTDDPGDAAAAGQAIDLALAALDGVDTLIVDVRFNGGGFDAVALALADRFADQKRLAFSKQARNGSGFTPRRDFYVEPGGERQFTGPVYVLTSGTTASAAEIFVMALDALPNVITVGQATSGGHSDILSRSLPNGWTFGLSNEVYYASDGQVYEKIGLPPDQGVPFDAAGFKSGADNVVNMALLLAES